MTFWDARPQLTTCGIDRRCKDCNGNAHPAKNAKHHSHSPRLTNESAEQCPDRLTGAKADLLNTRHPTTEGIIRLLQDFRSQPNHRADKSKSPDEDKHDDQRPCAKQHRDLAKTDNDKRKKDCS